MGTVKASNKVSVEVMLLILITILYTLPQTKSQIHDPPSVYLSLRGTNYFTNNSDILITEIGETISVATKRGGALACNTDLTNCCRDTKNGNWFFPTGEKVINSGFGNDMYRNRGPQFVALNRINNATQPTGLYCCQVPDASGETQTFCANIVESLTVQNTIPASLTITRDTIITVIAAGTAVLTTFMVVAIFIIVFTTCCLIKHRWTTQAELPQTQNEENNNRTHITESTIDTSPATQDRAVNQDDNDSQYENIYDYADLELGIHRNNRSLTAIATTKCVAYGQVV